MPVASAIALPPSGHGSVLESSLGSASASSRQHSGLRSASAGTDGFRSSLAPLISPLNQSPAAGPNTTATRPDDLVVEADPQELFGATIQSRPQSALARNPASLAPPKPAPKIASGPATQGNIPAADAQPFDPINPANPLNLRPASLLPSSALPSGKDSDKDSDPSDGALASESARAGSSRRDQKVDRKTTSESAAVSAALVPVSSPIAPVSPPPSAARQPSHPEPATRAQLSETSLIQSNLTAESGAAISASRARFLRPAPLSPSHVTSSSSPTVTVSGVDDPINAYAHNSSVESAATQLSGRPSGSKDEGASSTSSAPSSNSADTYQAPALAAQPPVSTLASTNVSMVSAGSQTSDGDSVAVGASSITPTAPESAPRAALRNVHGNHSAHASSESDSILAMQADTALRPVSAAAQEPAVPRDAAHASVAIAPSAGSRDAFTALDALPANVDSTLNPTWIHAGAQHAEAGFEDPALGWISVRAGVDNGSVHASLIPSSDVASTALSGHLAGLNAFLSQQHSGVLGVTIAAPENSAGSASGMGSNAGQNSNQTLGQNSNQSSSGQGSEGPTQSRTEAVSSVLSRSASMTGADVQRSIEQTEFTPALRPGARISLMA